jgi:hypothetical protein
MDKAREGRVLGSSLNFCAGASGPCDLIAEREAQGQLGLPGTERITQGELATTFPQARTDLCNFAQTRALPWREIASSKGDQP